MSFPQLVRIRESVDDVVFDFLGMDPERSNPRSLEQVLNAPIFCEEPSSSFGVVPHADLEQPVRTTVRLSAFGHGVELAALFLGLPSDLLHQIRILLSDFPDLFCGSVVADQNLVLLHSFHLQIGLVECLFRMTSSLSPIVPVSLDIKPELG